MLGTDLQEYKITKLIGEGGMATVYLAHNNKFDTDVALKVLKTEFFHNENIRKRFIAEARNMFKMSHPNIIKVTDLIEEGDTVAFVMEYVEGETLKEYIDRKGKLKDKEIKNLFAQMLDALAYVHEQKLVHRDIKPSNFMVDKQGKVKLMDFGIAKNTDTSSAEYTITGTSQSMGTPLYMSPEQIKSTKAVTLQSDIYSLGVVLWNMVTGKKPYDAETSSTFDLQTKIVNEKLPSTSSIFDTIIEKSTAKNLDERFKNCGEFKNNLENLQKEDNESTKAYTSQNSEKTIIETAADKTIIEKTKQPEIISPPKIKTPYNPPVEKSNSNILFIILGILLIIGLGIAITNKSNSYEEEDYALADTLVVDSMAVDTTVFVSESKTVSFKNNSNLTVYLAYAFWNNTTWESVGWYEIAPNQSYEISLPESFSENSIYWYAEDSEGAKYESNDGYFCVDHEEPFHFYKNKDCGTQEGFYKLNLTGTYTEQGLR
jgi:serine/threonine-protein kinase